MGNWDERSDRTLAALVRGRPLDRSLATELAIAIERWDR
jgi:hypothetical protein